MWVFTESGFVSVVRHYEETGVLIVRARDRDSLDVLSKLSNTPVKTSPYSDYPYRVHVADKGFKAWISDAVNNLEYTNFKNHVFETRGPEFARALAGVWEIMHDVEDAEARQ